MYINIIPYRNQNSKVINGLPASLQHYLFINFFSFFLDRTYSSTLIENNRHWYSSHWGPPLTWYVILVSFLWMSMVVFIRLCKIVNEPSWVEYYKFKINYLIWWLWYCMSGWCFMYKTFITYVYRSWMAWIYFLSLLFFVQKYFKDFLSIVWWW